MRLHRRIHTVFHRRLGGRIENVLSILQVLKTRTVLGSYNSKDPHWNNFKDISDRFHKYKMLSHVCRIRTDCVPHPFRVCAKTERQRSIHSHPMFPQLWNPLYQTIIQWYLFKRLFPKDAHSTLRFWERARREGYKSPRCKIFCNFHYVLRLVFRYPRMCFPNIYAAMCAWPTVLISHE